MCCWIFSVKNIPSMLLSKQYRDLMFNTRL